MATQAKKSDEDRRLAQKWGQMRTNAIKLGMVFTDEMHQNALPLSFVRLLNEEVFEDIEDLRNARAWSPMDGKKSGPAMIRQRLIRYINQKISIEDLTEVVKAADKAMLDAKVKPTTLKNVLVAIRKAAKDTYGPDSAEWKVTKKHLTDPVEYYAKVIEEQAEKTAAGNRAPIPIVWAKLMRLVKESRDADTVTGLMAFIELATGARMSEISYISSFTDAGGGNITQHGIAKKAERKDVRTEVTKPALFATPAEIIRKHAKLRSLLDAKQFGSTGNQQLYEFLSGYKPYNDDRRSFTTHDLRRIYAILSHIVYGGSQTQNVWLMDKLGHENPGAAIAYSILDIKPTPAEIAEVRAMSPTAPPLPKTAPPLPPPPPQAAAPAPKKPRRNRPQHPPPPPQPAAAPAPILPPQAAAPAPKKRPQPQRAAAPAPPQDAAAAGEIPRSKNRRGAGGLEDIRATIAAMEQNGMTITDRSIKSYGYGNAAIANWRKAAKA
jgi:hypothetical protein